MNRAPSESEMRTFLTIVMKQIPYNYEMTLEMVKYWEEHPIELRQILSCLKERPSAPLSEVHKDYELEYFNENIEKWKTTTLHNINKMLGTNLKELRREQVIQSRNSNRLVRCWRRVIRELFYEKPDEGWPYNR